jgi:RES domain-containing protein
MIDTDLDGLAPSVAYVDANSVKPAALARMLLEKLNALATLPQTSLNIWRIVSSRYATTPFSFHGAATFGGRWNQVGTQAVYAAIVFQINNFQAA